ncbi:MAG TPA: tetratricopeptide repeat protein [Pyrinomonadaceae bacterium]|jgi:tetratricopeptide (TPR) repeat protein|nr:tetratricopeptide repeat protein [Pyrinomonadaceae bacterium]
MFRRYLFTVLATAAFLFSTCLLAAAQNGELRGHVTMKQADGTLVPAVDAVVDVFRTDLPGDFNLKTNKKGDFVHAGLPLQGTYIIAVSMPGAQPFYLQGVRAGRDEEVKIELSPGDGRRLTRTDIKTIMARVPGTGTAAPTSEDKAKREEIMRKNAEIEAANKKAEASNAIVDRTFKAGNEALKAKNYDLAIAQFDEGLNADPEHPGAPALLTNKTMALNARGVEKYNAGVRASDDAAKTAGIEAAKKDWQAAAEASAKAVSLLKALPVPTDPAAANNAKINLYFALMARADATRLFVTKVDSSKIDSGVTAYQEYIAAETDPVKKSKAEHDMAQMLFDANVFDRALSEYQKILAANPDDLTALLRAGQALFNIGAINSDKTKYQEAANYLAQFVEKAPDTDPLKSDAKAILETMKDQANVKPEKAATPVRRTRRP